MNAAPARLWLPPQRTGPLLQALCRPWALRQFRATSRYVCSRMVTSKTPCNKANRHHFGITAPRDSVGRLSPLPQGCGGFQEIIYNAVDLSHLLVYAVRHRSSSSEVKSKVASRFYSSVPDWRPCCFNSGLGLTKYRYALQANAYINKPLELDRFLGMVKQTVEFWTKLITLS